MEPAGREALYIDDCPQVLTLRLTAVHDVFVVAAPILARRSSDHILILRPTCCSGRGFHRDEPQRGTGRAATLPALRAARQRHIRAHVGQTVRAAHAAARADRKHSDRVRAIRMRQQRHCVRGRQRGAEPAQLHGGGQAAAGERLRNHRQPGHCDWGAHLPSLHVCTLSPLPARPSADAYRLSVCSLSQVCGAVVLQMLKHTLTCLTPSDASGLCKLPPQVCSLHSPYLQRHALITADKHATRLLRPTGRSLRRSLWRCSR